MPSHAQRGLRSLACLTLSGGDPALAARMCDGVREVKVSEGARENPAVRLLTDGLPEDGWEPELRRLRAALACSLYDFDCTSLDPALYRLWQDMDTGAYLRRCFRPEHEAELAELGRLLAPHLGADVEAPFEGPLQERCARWFLGVQRGDDKDEKDVAFVSDCLALGGLAGTWVQLDTPQLSQPDFGLALFKEDFLDKLGHILLAAVLGGATAKWRSVPGFLRLVPRDARTVFVGPPGEDRVATVSLSPWHAWALASIGEALSRGMTEMFLLQLSRLRARTNRWPVLSYVASIKPSTTLYRRLEALALPFDKAASRFAVFTRKLGQSGDLATFLEAMYGQSVSHADAESVAAFLAACEPRTPEELTDFWFGSVRPGGGPAPVPNAAASPEARAAVSNEVVEKVAVFVENLLGDSLTDYLDQEFPGTRGAAPLRLREGIVSQRWAEKIAAGLQSYIGTKGVLERLRRDGPPPQEGRSASARFIGLLRARGAPEEPSVFGPLQRARRIREACEALAGDGSHVITEALIASKELEGCLIELVLGYAHVMPWYHERVAAKVLERDHLRRYWESVPAQGLLPLTAAVVEATLGDLNTFVGALVKYGAENKAHGAEAAALRGKAPQAAPSIARLPRQAPRPAQRHDALRKGGLARPARTGEGRLPRVPAPCAAGAGRLRPGGIASRDGHHRPQGGGRLGDARRCDHRLQ